MVSGIFADFKARDLHKVKDKMNQTVDYMIPFGTLFVSQEFVLVQDNYSKHTIKLCQRETTYPLIDDLVGTISRLKSHWTGVGLT